MNLPIRIEETYNIENENCEEVLIEVSELDNDGITLKSKIIYNVKLPNGSIEWQNLVKGKPFVVVNDELDDLWKYEHN